MSEYHYTVSTNKTVEQTIQDLENVLKEDKFGILWKFEIHKKLAEKGLNASKNITVLEVCNPEEAHGMLEKDPMASYFLPCKMVVTEEGDHTKVGLVRPTTLIGLMEQEGLNQVAKNIEDRLIHSIDKAI
ncbi:DUF302 domain-containing protein [Tepidibacillus infernus]|uniref:DUF302 domain-containing protein n=1 Tax=Tepidibacillus infernus TaxID=1806172 RepID=UPI003B72533C